MVITQYNVHAPSTTPQKVEERGQGNQREEIFPTPLPLLPPPPLPPGLSWRPSSA
jgi:hypothetical protein